MNNSTQEPQKSSNKNEEIDLIVLFNLIGRAFSRFFNLIGSFFKAIFSVFVYALKAVIVNIKTIAVVVILTSIVGYVIEKSKEDVYISHMIVKPYFDSKYQLVTNINYYNALIGEKDYSQLSEIFSISKENAGQIIEFEINPGPENENEQIKQYDDFLKGLDSIRANEIDFDEFLENRSIYSGDIFQIYVKSYQKDIFRSLEKGLNSTFTNTYSIKKMRKRDSLIAIDKSRILASLKKVDSLKNVYIRVMEEESRSKEGSYTTKDGMSFIQEKTKTREFDLLQEENKLRQDLSRLESQKVEEDTFFDTLSSFQDVGAKYTSITEKYSLIFPILAFMVLNIIFLTQKLIKFAKNYEG